MEKKIQVECSSKPGLIHHFRFSPIEIDFDFFNFWMIIWHAFNFQKYYLGSYRLDRFNVLSRIFIGLCLCQVPRSMPRSKYTKGKRSVWATIGKIDEKLVRKRELSFLRRCFFIFLPWKMDLVCFLQPFKFNFSFNKSKMLSDPTQGDG